MNTIKNPQKIAGLESCHGLMPDDFITINSWSDNILLYTNKTAAKRDMGARMVKMRGINRVVSSTNMPMVMPLEAIMSKNLKDCESHIIDIKEKLISKKPISICLVMYVFSLFIVADYNRYILYLNCFMQDGRFFVNCQNVFIN